MNYTDYKNWANEYREQVEVLEMKLEERKNRKRFSTAEERMVFENTTRIFREMRRDCIRALAVLEQRAEQIKEAEMYGESIVA